MIRLTRPEAASSHNPNIEAVVPDAVLPGAEVEIRGSNLAAAGLEGEALKAPVALLDGKAAPLALCRPTRLRVRIPEAAGEGRLEVRRNGSVSNSVQIHVGRLLSENVHPVSNPVADASGNVYTTLSGARGQQVPVSVFRISPEGDIDSFMTGLVNATGLAVDADGVLYVSSRHEGTIHRVTPQGAASIFTESMGVATGLAFDAEGNLYCGDRSGTIFKIARDRQIFVYATLEPSVAAYHLAFGLDGTLFVTAPTTSSFDVVHAIDTKGNITNYYRGLGRPQGLALDIAGNLYVAASLRGQRGIVRITPDKEAELVISGSGIVGLAFIPNGSVAVATQNAIYDVALGIEGLRLF